MIQSRKINLTNGTFVLFKIKVIQMKKHILFSVIFLHIFNLGISQNEKSMAVAAGAIGVIGAIASYANCIKQYEE